jgi:hypothetical protein
MSGGKGGSTTSSVEIPEYIEEAARRNLGKAEDISQIGYVPYYGPDVAAFTPFQEAGFQQTADVASAFGVGPQMSQTDIMGGMPAATEFTGGVRGYSSAPLYQQAVDKLAAQRPAQAQFIESFFIDPVTGQVGSRVPTEYDYTSPVAPVAPVAPVDSGGGGVAPIVAPVAPSGGYDFTPSTEVLVGPLDGDGQESQFYNPDIDYDDAFVAESGQLVGVLDPNEAALEAMEAEAGIDPSFYTDTPIYSASDFPLGSSLSGTDYTTYAPSGTDGLTAIGTPVENNVATNQFGSTISVGYDVGQVDPALAAAAGYSLAGQPEIPSLPPQVPYLRDPDTQASTLITDPAASITDTSTASAFTQQMNDIQEALIGMLPLDESYSVGGVNNPIETPTLGEMQAAAPPQMAYSPSTGSYVALEGAMPTGAVRPPSRPTGDEVSGGGLLSDIGEFIASGGVTGAVLKGVGGLLEPALGAAESGIASMIGDPRTFAEREADRLEAERLRAIDKSQEESAAVEAQREAALTEQEKLKVADPEAFVAQFDKEGKADAKKAVKTAQNLAVAPRPPKLTGGKAKDWIKANVGVSVDKKDATDYIRSLQQDWDRQNG